MADEDDGRDDRGPGACPRRLHVSPSSSPLSHSLPSGLPFLSAGRPLTRLPRLSASRLWNYNPDNDDHTGDDWNGENFSWFSQKRALPPTWLDHAQHSPTLDNGGRILRAVVRPYPAKTAGVPLRFDYEINTSEFTFEWAIPGSADAPASASSAVTKGGPSVRTPPLGDMPPLTSNKTEIFYPSLLAHGRKVVVRGLAKEDRWAYDEARQTLTIVTANNSPGRVHRVTVGVDPLPKEAFEVNDFWGDFGGQILALSLVIVTVAVLLFSWLLG